MKKPKNKLFCKRTGCVFAELCVVPAHCGGAQEREEAVHQHPDHPGDQGRLLQVHRHQQNCRWVPANALHRHGYTRLLFLLLMLLLGSDTFGEYHWSVEKNSFKDFPSIVFFLIWNIFVKNIVIFFCNPSNVSIVFCVFADVVNGFQNYSSADRNSPVVGDLVVLTFRASLWKFTNFTVYNTTTYLPPRPTTPPPDAATGPQAIISCNTTGASNGTCNSTVSYSTTAANDTMSPSGTSHSSTDIKNVPWEQTWDQNRTTIHFKM